jgi:UDP-3-O-[3-hydroxymyristoyl] glucosamine N-acyltransferase
MHQGSHTAASIADMLRSRGIEVELRGDAGAPATGVASAEKASAGHITFYRTESFAKAWNEGTASAALVSRKHADAFAVGGSSRAILVVPDADLAFIAVLQHFAPPEPHRAAEVHPTAVVHATAMIDPSAHVGPHCVIDAGAVVGKGAILISGVHVGTLAHVGDHSTLHPHVRVLDRCVVGKHCLLHAGATLGADGFGFRPNSKGGLAKVPQIGNVVLGDDVEVGANTCIDRATIGTTTIGSGTKLDNLVQIGHNCVLGRCCIVCGNSAIGGSVTMGDGIVIGGSVSIADGVSIGSGAQIAAGAGVINDIPAGETWIGAPAGPVSEMRRNIAAYRRLAETLSEIKKQLRS